MTPEQARLVRDHLKVVLDSEEFVHSRRAQEFLRRVVRHALAGELDQLTERMLGAEMFGRPIAYDTGSDSVVRVKASEVRKKLAQFYLNAANRSTVHIELPRGSYIPTFTFSNIVSPPEPISPSEPSTGGSEAQEPDAPLNTSIPIAATIQPPRRRGIMGFLLVGLLVSVAVGSLWVWRTIPRNRVDIQSIAVLPFVDLSGHQDQDYFADGITDELIADLGQLSTLRVISRTSTMSLKGSHKLLPEIAKQLGVDGIVEGTVQSDDNQVRITIKLIDAPHDRLLWANSYTLDRSNALALQAELAETIAKRADANPANLANPRKGWTAPTNTAAEEFYLQGLRQLNADNCSKAIDYFQHALGEASNAAQAHAGLAYCFGRLGESGQMNYSEAFSHQKEEAIKAIALDRSDPEGHIELANAAMNLNWDWTTAAREFHEALLLNPSSAQAHERYAIYLERTGRFDEAISEVEKSMLLDPVSDRSYTEAIFTYYFARHYDQALELHRKALASGILKAPIDMVLGNIYAEKSLYAKSVAAFRNGDASAHMLGHLGYVYGRSGNRAMALDTIVQIKKHVSSEGLGRYEIAMVYAGMGDKAQALFWLEEGRKTHDEGLTNLLQDPTFDSLRSDARFSSLLRSIGLSSSNPSL